MFRAIVFGIVGCVLLTGMARPSIAELKEEDLQRGRRATALVELPNRAGFGTAFCVSGDGFFVTNRHVVTGVGVDGKVNIVISPGEKADEPIEATVVELSDRDDLALLHAPKASGTPALQLGDSSKLRETIPVTVFGYPFGNLLAVERQRYPNISVNVGRISALRGERIAPSFIQTDARLNRGNSGGPMLDDNGRVIGVIAAGVQNAGITLAIPVDKVKAMLQRPQVTLEPIEVAHAARYKPLELQFEAKPIVRGLGEVESVQVQVDRSGKPAIFPATRKADGRYAARIVPLEAPEGPPRWPIEVEYSDGSVRGLAADRAIKIGDRTVKLSELRSIEHDDAGVKATTHDGKTLSGSLADTAGLTVRVGGRDLELKLNSARRLTVQSQVSEPARMTVTVIAMTKDGQSVRKEQPLRIVDAPQAVDRATTGLRASDWDLFFYSSRWQKTPLERIKAVERAGVLSLTYETGPHVIAWVGYQAKQLDGDFSVRMEIRGAWEVGIRPTTGSDAGAIHNCESSGDWQTAEIMRRNGQLSMKIDGKPVDVTYNANAKANLIGVVAITIYEGKTLEIRSFQLDVGQGKAEAAANSKPPVGFPAPPTQPGASAKASDPITIAPPPQLGTEPLTIDLPEKFTAVRSGGGGRYLIFHQPRKKKLAVFDVSAGQIVTELPLTSDQVLFAAGRNKLMVVLPGERLIQRWDLATLKRDTMVPVPGAKTPMRIMMGSASDGPLWLWPGGSIEPFDISRMRTANYEGSVLGGEPQYGYTMLFSADGSTATGWSNGLSSPPYDLMRVVNNRTSTSPSPFGEGTNGRWMWPNADGSLIFGNGSGVYDYHFKRIAAEWLQGGSIVPTVDRRYFLLVKSEGKDRSNISICTSNDRRIIYTLTKIENVTQESHLDWGRFGGEPRVYYIPSAEMLITLPIGDKQIIVRRISLPAALKEQGVDYLYVDSFAPVQADRGQAWRYQISAHTSKSGLTYKLESGPDGMMVDASGLVAWNIPARFKDDSVSAIVSIQDNSGNEALHTVNFDVKDRSPN